MGHRRRLALVAVALTLAMGACGTGDGDDGSTDGGSAAQSSAPTPTSIDPALLECGDPANQGPSVQLSDSELSTATWTMPQGFVETFKYSEDRPVEHIESFWAAEPAQDPVPLNVLAVVVYSGLSWGEDIDQCGRVPTAAIDERLDAYREGSGAEPIGDLAEVEISGLPAVQQDVALPEYSYRGYWVFGRHQLVHLYCQWTSDAEKDRVLAGCDALVASVEVAGG